LPPRTIDAESDPPAAGRPSGGSARAKLAGATSLLAASVLLSRILGYVRDAIINAKFGQGQTNDLYANSFNIPDTLYFVIAGGAISSAFIPVFSSYWARKEEDEAWTVFSTVLTLMVPIIATIVVLMEVYAYPLSALMAPNWPPDRIAQLATLTRIVLPAQLCFFIGSVLIGTQNARGNFVGQAVGPLIYNLCIILGGLWLSKTHSIAGFSWGAMIGAILGPLLLQIVLVKRLGVRFKPSLNFRHPGVIQVGMLALPVLLGLSLPQIDLVINKWFATFLADGRVAALNNANRLMQVPLGVFAQSAGIALLPALSAQAAVLDFAAFRISVNRGVRSIIALTMPISAIMVALSIPIVKIAYERGKFGPADTYHCAVALVFYSVGIFAWSAQAIIARAFYALHDTRTPIVVGTLMTFLFIPMNWLLMRPLDHGGLALSTTIAAALHSLILLELLRRRVGGLHMTLLAQSFVKVTLASAVCGAAAWVAYYLVLGHVIHSHRILALLVRFVVSSGVAGLVYAGAVTLLKVEEARESWQVVARRFGGRKARSAA
jgi:putative peptidoglycan lipid II flippase